MIPLLYNAMKVRKSTKNSLFSPSYFYSIVIQSSTCSYLAGEWEFSLEEEIYTLSHYLVLTINLGRHCDTHDIRLDIRPKLARVLARGHLLQLHLPQEVICDKVACRRSMATGKLVIEMPVEHPNRFLIDAKKRQKERLIRNGSSGNNNTEKALVYIEAAESSQLDDDALPPLCI